MLASAWQEVRQRIQNSATESGRDPCAIHLLSVSKTFPVDSIRSLYHFGQRDFGENYVQEFMGKVAELQDCPEIVWHFIGPLQSNKTRIIAEMAHWFHALDRIKIAERLSAQRPGHLSPLNVCLQVNVSGEASKSGVAPAEVLTLAAQVRQLPGLKLRGLMCIPEPTTDQGLLARRFALLRELFIKLNEDGFELDTLSMGMSSDMELAIREGSTIVRIGSAIFGARTKQQEMQ